MKVFIIILVSITSFNIVCQTINSGFSWLSSDITSSATSPIYSGVTCTDINYTINSTEYFGGVNNGFPYNNNCIIIPFDIGISSSYIDVSISFNQPINNLSIRFIDLDENVSGFAQPEESITQIVPPPSSVSNLNLSVNPFFLVSGIITPEDNISNINNNDASGWVNWTGTLMNVNFRYNRPGELYGLIIDSIYFDCPSCIGDCASEIEMPNVYSPNSDETNDQFLPITYKNIKSANLIIVNRWGNIIFNGSNLFSGWDGTSNGNECTEGVYFWKIEYEDFNSNKFNTHGFIHLVR